MASMFLHEKKENVSDDTSPNPAYPNPRGIAWSRYSGEHVSSQPRASGIAEMLFVHTVLMSDAPVKRNIYFTAE